MKRMHATLAALFALAATTAADARSGQYTQTRAPVRWNRGALTFVVDPSLRDPSLPSPAEVVSAAAAAWQDLPHVPRFDVRAGSLGPLGFDLARRQNNASGIALYRRNFPRRLDRPALALTLATRNADTGEILDADVIVDAEHFRFAVLSTAGMLGMPDAPYDYQNVFTHELGHVLGLTEDPNTPGAVMYPSSRPGEVNKRNLHAEDRASIEEVYAAAPTGEDPFAQMQPGCGGAHVAPTRGPVGARELVFVALGLLALGALRARWRRGWVFVTGGLLLAVGAPEPVAERPVDALVLRAQAHAEGGVIVTRALVATGSGVREVEALGGRVGDVEQVVYDGPSGHALQPGAHVDGRDYGLAR